MTYEFPTITNLVYLFRDNQVLLIMKKRGFGEGKYNGPGGKVKEGETVEECAVRELQEEIRVTPRDLEKLGYLEFVFLKKLEWNTIVHVYRAGEFEGEPEETEECIPEWFDLDKIPYPKMWDDDNYWFPIFLRGEKFKKRFYFGEGNEMVVKYEDI
ncbi:8-oxo-dGTP diphosphatase [Candidatus Falkowbacteria bacterium]|nr:8-oxo-dGTP diphosphatase [Candidatus Falkowbacteria bacterium]